LIPEEPDTDNSSDSVIGTSTSAIIGDIDLPKGPDDGQNEQRVSDLIVMANHLETRDGVSHVAFNFLAIEICSALQTAINERHEEITGRWATSNSRTYITRLLRSLGNAGVFKKGWHTGKDQDTGKSRRRSTFNLDHTHQLVKTVLREQTDISGEYTDTQPDDSNSTNQETLSSNGEVSKSGDTNPFGISKVIKLFSRS